MPTTADAEMIAYIARHGLSGADHDFTLAYGRRRYEEGRDGTRQRQTRFWGDVLAEMRSGVRPPLDAEGLGRLMKMMERA